MKRRIMSWLAATTLLLTITSQVSAHAYALNTYGPDPRASGAYAYFVEVCVGASTGSTTWNTAGIPLHARAADAVATWNVINGELRFSLSNSCVASETFIVIDKGNYGSTFPKARLENLDWIPSCAAPWDCISNWSLKINLYYSWWNQDSTPNPNQWDLESAFVHELGHALSAPELTSSNSHCLISESTASSMCGYLLNTGESWMRTLSVDDVQTYESRFGTNP